jgi:uncharacterized repeat protein (TIGR02543 family)
VAQPANAPGWPLTLYAQWQPASYTVIFKNYNAMPIGDPQLIEHGESATPPADPARTGWRFTGWDKPYDNITGATVITAQFTQLFTVTVTNGTGGGKFAAGDNVDISATMPPGYELPFLGWDIAPAGAIAAPPAAQTDSFVMPAASVTLTPGFTQSEYTVIFDPGAYGTFLADAYTTTGLHYGDATPAAPTTASKDAKFVFDKWSAKPADKVTGSVTYTALWKPDITKIYTVAYKPGQYGTFTAITHNGLHYADTTPAPPANHQASNDSRFIFEKWEPAITATVDGNASYEAKWIPDPGKLYAVTYNANGATGTAPADSTAYSYNASATVLGQGELKRPGYTFTGWALTAGGGVAYGENGVFAVTDNITLYAVWHKIPETDLFEKR